MKICSLLPGATEIIYQLGMGEHLVAVSDDCDYPPEVKNKPTISKSALSGKNYSSLKIHSIVEHHKHTGLSMYDISTDLLKRLKPDLILTQELCDVCAVPYTQVLKSARLLDYKPTIVSLEPKTIEDVFENIMMIGRLVGRSGRAEALCFALRRRIEYVKSKVKELKRFPRMMDLEWIDPPMAGGHWIPQMIQIAGGLDGLGQVGGPTVRLNWKRIALYQPEVIIIIPCGSDLEKSVSLTKELQKIPEWKELPAVKYKRVYAANSKWYFSRSGPRLVDGIEILAEVLHPELSGTLAPPDSYVQVLQ